CCTNIITRSRNANSSPADLHDHLDRVLDALARIADRGRHLTEWEGVGVYEFRVEALLRHQSGGAVCRALALAANPKDVDVVAHEIGQIDRHRLGWKGREADAPAAIDHARRLIQRIGRPRTFEHILHALPPGQALHR